MTRIAWISLVFATLAACRPVVRDGACSDTAPCRLGLECDAELHLCVLPEGVEGCALPCGDGFRCAKDQAGKETCELQQGAEATIEVVSPAAGAAKGAGSFVVECRATAPQLDVVDAVLDGPGGVHVVLESLEASGADGVFASAFALDGRPEGEWTLVCRMRFGPESGQFTLESTVSTLRIDRTGPAVTLAADGTVHPAHGTFTVHATVEEAGAIDAESVRLVLGARSVPGTASGTDGFAFDVDLGDLGVTRTASLTFTVEVMDTAGNTGTAQGTLRIDATPPVLMPQADAHWYARGVRLSVVTRIEVESAGAQVVPTTVKLSAPNGTTADGVRGTGDAWSFEVEAAALASAGTEGEIEVTLAAEDEAGNTGTATTTLRIDDVAPTGNAASHVTGWVARGPVAVVDVTAADGGAGVDPAGVEVVRGTGTAACTAGTTGFTCEAETATAAQGTTTAAHPVSIHVRDRAGNLATLAATLQVDDAAPELAIASDSAWYARGDELLVDADLTDAGAGVAGATITAAVTTQALTGATPVPGVLRQGNSWRFTFRGSQLARAGLTLPNFGLAITATDAVGNSRIATVSRRLDDQPPTIANIVAPGTAVVRNAAPVTITATVRDTGTDDTGASVSGSGLGTPVLRFPDASGASVEVAGTSAGGDAFTFSLSPAAPRFQKGSGPVDALELVAADAVGLANAVPVTLNVTRLLWSFDTRAAGAPTGPPAISGDKVFVTSNGATAGLHNVYALARNVRTPTQYVWSNRVEAVLTTPPLVSGTTIVFGSDATNSGGPRGRLHAFEMGQTGIATEAWNCSTVPAGTTGSDSTPNGAFATGSVSWSGTPSTTYLGSTRENRWVAIRRNQSACEWKLLSVPSTVGSLAITGNAAFSGSSSGAQVHRAATTNTTTLFGALSSTASTSGQTSPIPGVALTAEGNVFYAHRPFAAYLDGSSLTERVRRASITGFSSATSTGPALATGTLAYFGSEDGRVFGIDISTPTGTEPMNRPLGGAAKSRGTPVVGRPPAGSGLAHVIYITTTDGKVHALSPAGASGTLEWTWDLGADQPTDAGATLGCDGVLFVATNTSRVVALVTDSPGLLPGAWPKGQHDVRNSGNVATPLADSNGACVE